MREQIKETRHLVCSDVLEVCRATILLREPVCALVELASLAAGALGGVGAIEIRNVVISNITEPGSSCK